MKSNQIISSALFAALSLGLVGQASASQETGAKEKCYGVSKAGQNDCANLSGSHSCAGQAKAEMSADEWKYVAKGTCKSMSGMSADEAKVKMKK